MLLNVLHHQKINRKYLKNRFFIRCDGIINIELLINEIANSMGLLIDGQIDMTNFLLNNLKRIEEPKLIALDNFEKPFWKKTKMCYILLIN